MRPQQYSNGYGEDDDDDLESEAPPSYTATLESITLGRDAENERLLDQVDQLRECRVDEYINLPQIVVVGDQSTGKSSVLESLTKVPFPTSSVKCTRYATQIRLRRDAHIRREVSILPDRGATNEEKRRLAAFNKAVDDGVDFDTIFNQAKETIFPSGTGQHENFLSKHILSIQISGPTQPHLTVVDLPGIIHAATHDQTEEDKVAILALARHYMDNKRTIILPVVNGNNDISNQLVLQMVKEIDKKGVRTLGIITKPDMTLTDARELEFINLALNKDKRNKLLLGWHVLRNRAHDEVDFTTEQRNRTEKDFFASSNWGKKLRPELLGIDALSKRLSTQLIRHIAAEVFNVKDEIKQQLESCREKLAELGEGQDGPKEMHLEIYRCSELSLRLTQAAIQGHGVNPSGEDFFPSFNDGKTYARNFRSRVVKQNQIFAAQMEDWGASYIISDDGQQNGQPSKRSTSKPGADSTIVPEISRSDYLKKVVHPIILDNPGQELSMDINPLLVYRLFHSFSEKWILHASQHIDNIHKLCDEYLNQVLQYAWPKRIQYRVWNGFIQSQIDSMRAGAQKELDKIKVDRLRLGTSFESDFLKKWYQWKESDRSKQREVDLTEQRYEDLLQKMLFLYECNLPKFLTNIITQVVERHIVDGLERVFKDSRVRELTEEEVKRMVEDDYNIRTERKELRDQESVLAKGEEICREISMRSDLGPYEYQDPSLQPTPTRSQTHSNGSNHRVRTSSQRYHYPAEQPSGLNTNHQPQSPVDNNAAQQTSPRTPRHPPPIPPPVEVFSDSQNYEQRLYPQESAGRDGNERASVSSSVRDGNGIGVAKRDTPDRFWTGEGEIDPREKKVKRKSGLGFRFKSDGHD